MTMDQVPLWADDERADGVLEAEHVEAHPGRNARTEHAEPAAELENPEAPSKCEDVSRQPSRSMRRRQRATVTNRHEHRRSALADLDTLLPRLLGVEELCRILGVGRTTVFEEIAAGELNPVKIHRRTLFDQRDVADYLDRKRDAARRRRSPGPRRRNSDGLAS
jgi:excisionase family DNA binding protein